MAKGMIASLTENYEFQRVYKKQAPVYGRYIVLYAKKNNFQRIRLGITATKKIGKACKRNRARRLIFESFRHMYPNIVGKYDIVIVAKASMVGASYQEIYDEMHRLIKKAGLYDE